MSLPLKVLFAMILAFTVNNFVYFSFTNTYSSILLNFDTFSKQYGNGIYQYRFLSTFLLEWVYNIINSLPFEIRMKTYLWDKTADPNMLFAFAVLNTFFTALTAATMILITELKCFIASESEKMLLVAVAVFGIAITQFIIVPYDCSSYFFLAVFVWLFLKYIENGKNSLLLPLILVIIISSLNRESSALSISFAAAVLLTKFGLRKETFIPIMWFTFAYIAVYVGLRLYYGSFSTNDGSLLKLNFTLTRNLFGILFWGVFFTFSVLLANEIQNFRMILLFHLFSLPYILMCFYTGIMYEIRLYIPLFLGSLFLTKINVELLESRIE